MLAAVGWGAEISRTVQSRPRPRWAGARKHHEVAAEKARILAA